MAFLFRIPRPRTVLLLVIFVLAFVFLPSGLFVPSHVVSVRHLFHEWSTAEDSSTTVITHALHHKSKSLPPSSTRRGTAPPAILLVHGSTQNSSHWKPHFRVLASLSSDFFAVDLPGHGQSSAVTAGGGGGGDDFDKRALAEFVNKVTKKKKLVIIGRGHGAKICLLATSEIPADLIQGFVFIAPSLTVAGVAGVAEQVRSKPTLFVWAVDDAIVPEAGASELMEKFPRAVKASMGTINDGSTANDERLSWRSHFPEVFKPSVFQTSLEFWMKENKFI